MECLNSLVSYKKQCVTDGTAKYLIQNLPAISTTFAANVANSDYMNAVSLFEDKLNFNANLISERVRTMFNSLVVPNDIYSSCACVAPSDFSGVTFMNKTTAYGIQLMFREVSKNGYFFIDTIRVLASNGTGNQTFTIEEDNGETTTFTVLNFVANKYNTVQLQYKVKTQKVKIYAIGLNFAQFKCFETPQGCGCGGRKDTNTAQDVQNKFYSIYQYDSATPDTYNTDGNVTGLQPCITYKCDTDMIVCNYAERFALPLLYFTGASILEESLISDRLNISTLTDLDARKQAIASYYEKGNSYLDNTATAIENALRASTGDNCLLCTGRRTGWLIG